MTGRRVVRHIGSGALRRRHAATGTGPEPSYVSLHRSGELADRATRALAGLSHCTLCPRACGANRLQSERGFCGAGPEAVVASWNVHHWEEPAISGTRGSGTIFFSGCTGRCLFCQNYPISQYGYGNPVSAPRLAEMMLELQGRGCHNINLVTPTHFVPQILAALDLASGEGLTLPLVFNCGGYESVSTLRLLEGVVDLWLPDAKYADDAVARRLSGFPAYIEHNRRALAEMYRQVGAVLTRDADGVARRGLIVRHMVLPNGLAGTSEILHWLAKSLSPAVHVSLMDQYFPAFRAQGDRDLSRKITPAEYGQALEAFEQSGLLHGWMQEHETTDWSSGDRGF